MLFVNISGIISLYTWLRFSTLLTGEQLHGAGRSACICLFCAFMAQQLRHVAYKYGKIHQRKLRHNADSGFGCLPKKLIARRLQVHQTKKKEDSTRNRQWLLSPLSTPVVVKTSSVQSSTLCILIVHLYSNR